ncbi:MAG: hypothetical protein ACJ8AD_03565, partial [Gemmatimonadaceae bacterium]
MIVPLLLSDTKGRHILYRTDTENKAVEPTQKIGRPPSSNAHWLLLGRLVEWKGHPSLEASGRTSRTRVTRMYRVPCPMCPARVRALAVPRH